MSHDTFDHVNIFSARFWNATKKSTVFDDGFHSIGDLFIRSVVNSARWRHACKLLSLGHNVVVNGGLSLFRPIIDQILKHSLQLFAWVAHSDSFRMVLLGMNPGVFTTPGCGVLSA
jgi:hypothetical protein